MAKIKKENSFYQLKSSFLEDIRQTKEYACFLEKIGWQIIKIKHNYIYWKKIPFLPLVIIKILHPKYLIQLSKLKILPFKNKFLIIKIQPFLLNNNSKKKSALALKGEKSSWQKDNFPLIPTKTIWLNLKQTKQQLLMSMKQKTRYNIRLSQRKNIKTKIINGQQIKQKELKMFFNLWRLNKPFNWLFRPRFQELEKLISSFGKKCFFVLIKDLKTKNLLAGTLILQSPNMAFYWHNCSSKNGKKSMAPTLACWQAIIEAKKRSLKVFDFEGIWDQRFPQLNKGWQGFSRFKKSFGGLEIEFSPPKIAKLFKF